MRCPKCNHTQRKSEGKQCKKCHYQFVLLPKENTLNDYKLSQIIRRVSVNGQYAFTRSQLETEVLRHFSRNIMLTFRGGIIAGILSLITGLLLIVGYGLLFYTIDPTELFNHIPALVFPIILFVTIILVVFTLVSGGIGVSSVYYHIINSSSALASTQKKIQADIDQYLTVYPIPGLVDGKGLERDATDPHASPDNGYNDFQGIAPEAILVVERNDLVDALIKSRFHMQSKTAVVSQSGYPRQVFAALPSFIQAHPEIPVLVAHDISQAGLVFIEKLKQQPEWAFAANRFQDIGLSVESFAGYSTRLPWLTHKGKLVLSRDHQKQLEKGGCLPLDSFRPGALSTLFSSAVVTGGLLSLGLLVAASSTAVGSEIVFSIESDFG